MCDPGIILTKNVVMEKTRRLLEEAQGQMLTYINRHGFLKDWTELNIPPKISKGENYRGLPYLILDYPRVFRQHDTFAIRSFFWWGHFFSSACQLAGVYKEKMQGAIIQAYAQLAPHHYVNVSTDPWQHHFEEDNYRPIASFSPMAFEQHILKQDYIKIAAKYPLSDWHSAANFLFHNWKLWMEMVDS